MILSINHHFIPRISSLSYTMWILKIFQRWISTFVLQFTLVCWDTLRQHINCSSLTLQYVFCLFSQHWHPICILKTHYLHCDCLRDFQRILLSFLLLINKRRNVGFQYKVNVYAQMRYCNPLISVSSNKISNDQIRWNFYHSRYFFGLVVLFFN